MVTTQQVLNNVSSKTIMEGSKARLERLVDNTNRVLKSRIPITKEILIDLISEGELISKSSYYRATQVLQIIFDLEGINRIVLSEVSLSDVNTPEKFRGTYFKDFDDVYASIKAISKEEDAVDIHVDICYAVSAFLWNGIGVSSMVEIKKNDIKDNIVFYSGKQYELGLSQAFLINKYINTHYVDVKINQGTIQPQPYVTSEYILRSTTRGKLSPADIFRAFYTLSGCAKKHGHKEISINSIERSAQLAWIYNKRRSNPAISIAKANNPDLAQWYSMKETYDQWVKAFYER